MNLESDKQIVSVAVIAYNSSTTVLETLDSIVKQSYGPQNIELIISDDASKDNTVKVIETWLSEHGSRFYAVRLFANEVNGGIAKNCNVAWKAATSEWIKTIAGDDMLLPNCINDNFNYVSMHKNISVLFSKMKEFRINSSGGEVDVAIVPNGKQQKFFQLSAREQHKFLQRDGIGGAPSAFINRARLMEIGFADERFLMEDFPLWFKFTFADIKLYFMDVVTVKYRLGDSVSRSKTRLINEEYIKDIIKVDKALVIPSLGEFAVFHIVRKKAWANLALVIARIFNNKVNIVSRFFILCAYAIKPGFLVNQISKFKKGGEG